MQARYVDPPLPADFVPDIDAIALDPVRAVIVPDAAGGSEKLVGFDRRVYSFVRDLRDALLGTVILAVACQAGDNGQFVENPDAKFCIKKANKECVRKKCTLDGAPCSEDFIREMKVLKYLSDPGHPNIVRYLCMYEDDENYYALMEYIEGEELFDVVADALDAAGEPEGLGEPRTQRYTQHVLDGVWYMQEKHIAHLDMSCENAMLELATDTVKIIDFGAAMATDGMGGPLRVGRVGKLQYMAPEVYQGQYFNPWQADAWSSAIMTFIMSCGVPAWEHAADDQAAYNVNQQGQLPALLAHWGFDARMSAPCIDLVVRMLAHAPAARLAFGAVLAHPYVGLLPPPP